MPKNEGKNNWFLHWIIDYNIFVRSKWNEKIFSSTNSHRQLWTTFKCRNIWNYKILFRNFFYLNIVPNIPTHSLYTFFQILWNIVFFDKTNHIPFVWHFHGKLFVIELKTKILLKFLRKTYHTITINLSFE